jgi:SAM-dependent methyltransferase
VHELPFHTNSVDVVIAAFALNSTDPLVALAELHRVMRSGGRILIQEWDIEDTLSEIVSETFATYAVDDPPETLVAFREQMRMSIPWDYVEIFDDLINLLAESNFEIRKQIHESPPVNFTDVRQFLRYKLAWPARVRELEAMTPELRNLCLSDLQENVEPFAESNGNLIWKPNVFRVIAEA